MGSFLALARCTADEAGQVISRAPASEPPHRVSCHFLPGSRGAIHVVGKVAEVLQWNGPIRHLTPCASGAMLSAGSRARHRRHNLGRRRRQPYERTVKADAETEAEEARQSPPRRRQQPTASGGTRACEPIGPVAPTERCKKATDVAVPRITPPQPACHRFHASRKPLSWLPGGYICSGLTKSEGAKCLFWLAPAVGFEPTTNGLTVRCATAAPRRIRQPEPRCLAEGARRSPAQFCRWRPGPESNRRTRICSPLHDHSATGPAAASL